MTEAALAPKEAPPMTEETMHIVVYGVTDGEGPEWAQFIAKIMDPRFGPRSAKGRDGFLPTYFPARTAEEARAKAEEHIILVINKPTRGRRPKADRSESSEEIEEIVTEE